MKKENLVHKMVRLAIFLALGVCLNIVESLIPLPFAIPGVRLGLANTMTLIVLYFYSIKDYLLIGFLRVMIVGLIRTGIGSISFLLSFSGWFLSSLITLLIYLPKKASIFGLSIVSATFHCVGQIIVVILIYNQIAMLNYLPILLFSSMISGTLVAFVSKRIMYLLNKIFKREIKA